MADVLRQKSRIVKLGKNRYLVRQYADVLVYSSATLPNSTIWAVLDNLRKPPEELRKSPFNHLMTFDKQQSDGFGEYLEDNFVISTSHSTSHRIVFYSTSLHPVTSLCARIVECNR